MTGIKRRAHVGFVFVLGALCCGGVTSAQTQMSDPAFDTSIRVPAYLREHPKVVIDEAHHNFHTMSGFYKPLAQLLDSDGYKVVPGHRAFTSSSLRGIGVLIISNARGGEEDEQAGAPAFTTAECDTVGKWVRNGGALLLIADHTPFGSAARELALQFGVDMGRGYLFDPKNSDGNPTFMVYSEANGLLGDGPIISGRTDGERVHRIVAFTGQSLNIPRGAIALMKLSSSAFEIDSYADGQAVLDHRHQGATPRSSAGRAQGIALIFGRGRVVVVGEAAMFSAQLLKFDNPGTPDLKFGMNAPGNDDRQFAINVLHWLSGVIP